MEPFKEENMPAYFIAEIDVVTDRPESKEHLAGT
jgi:hypothetical protein